MADSCDECDTEFRTLPEGESDLVDGLCRGCGVREALLKLDAHTP